MDNIYHRWLRRYTPEGEIFYDRNTRRFYRERPHLLVDESQDCRTLPTFQTEAPLKVYFDFTRYCNLECRHCITNSSPGLNRDQEMGTKRIMSLMDELAAIGVFELGVGGGEPLTHPDIFLLLKYANSLQLNTVLTTNGILITPEKAQKLKDTGVSEVRVSFDGSERFHDDIRGAGRYHQAIEALKVLIQSGNTTVPRVTLCHDDWPGIDNLFHDLKSTGAISVKVSLVEPRGRAALKKNRDLFKHTRDSDTSMHITGLAQKNNLSVMLPIDLAPSIDLADGGEIRAGKRKSCGAGLETAYISPEGNVQPCSGLTSYIFGQVKSNQFIEAWTGGNASTWRERVCAQCSFCLCMDGA